jgi:hypothetical protein
MTRHPVSFAELADLVDGCLGEEARRRIGLHLASGCPVCERDVTWLEWITSTAKTDDTVEPPPASVSSIKALYRVRVDRAPPARVIVRRLRVSGFARRLAVAALLFIAAVTLASQVPFLFPRQASLSAASGTVQRRTAASTEWSELAEGESLSEGDSVRAVTDLAVLTLFDGSVLELQEGTGLTLATLRAGFLNGSHRVVLDQVSGSVDYTVASLESPFSSFETQAPTVRVEVRGTRFVVTVARETETQVSVLQGSVWLVNAVERTVLEERGVALVPREAAVIHLPTLLPTPSPVPTRTPVPTASLMPAVPTRSVEDTRSETSSRAPGEDVNNSATPSAALSWLAERAVTAKAPTRLPRSVSAMPTPSASLTISPPTVAQPLKREYGGLIKAFPPTLMGVWHIGARDFLANAETQISGRPLVGRRAEVLFLVPPNLALDGRPPLAVRIDVRHPGAAQTMAATATLPGTALATPTSRSSAEAALTPAPHVKATVQPSPSSSIETKPPPELTPGSRGTPNATGIAQPSSTPIPANTVPPNSTQSHEAPHTRSPSVTGSPLGVTNIVRFSGTIERFSPHSPGTWVIAGRTVAITPSTQIVGHPQVGLVAEVEAIAEPQGILRALWIKVRGAPANG